MAYRAFSAVAVLLTLTAVPAAAAADNAETVCAPLKVIVDDSAVPAPKHMVAYYKTGLGRGYRVVAFSEPGATCADVAARETSGTPEDLVVWASIDERKGRGKVGTANWSATLRKGIELVKKPAKAGDTVAICVPSTLLGGTSGPFLGKTVRIGGLFTAKYCGDPAK